MRVSTDYTRYARTETGEVVDESIHKTICDSKGGGRRNASTCSPTVPRGDTLCVTAGDAQRANPWDGDADNFSTPEVSHNTHKDNLSCKA